MRVVYSPLDAIKIARHNPRQDVVFFAMGFETTAPANAMAVCQAKLLGSTKFALLVAHVLVPPAIAAILVSPGNRVQGFLAPGHVCAWDGASTSRSRSDFRVPIVVTGFEPVDLLEGIRMLVRQLEEGRAEVENQYVRSVHREATRPRRGHGRGLRGVRPRVARHRHHSDERPRACARLRAYDAERLFPA